MAALLDLGKDELSEEDLALYRTYANLGTHLIHANFPSALAGDETSREAFREGLDLIEKAVEVNPGAHFGRENWQVVAAEYMLRVMEKPELLRRYDMIGNENVVDIDTMGSEAWRARVRHTSRRLATIHFWYPGYWIWFIPLRGGVTSVGVVAEKSAFPSELRSLDGFIDFLREHRAVASLLEEAKPVDFGNQ